MKKQRDLAWYVETAKERSGVKSDRQLSDLIGLSGVGVANWKRSDKAFPSDEAMMRLADIAGVDPYIALLDLNAMRSKGDAQKAYRKMLEKISVAVMVLGCLILHTNTVFASNLKQSVGVIPAYTSTLQQLYIITFYHVTILQPPKIKTPRITPRRFFKVSI